MSALCIVLRVCGIAGGWVEGKANRSLDETVRRAVKRLSHRGPDDTGILRWHVPAGGDVVLGSARLAILDLSPAGHMPMSTLDENFVLAYNGEVTNYVELRKELSTQGCAFRSGTDTEVILQAWATWGPAALDRFEGMYAFAILDKREATLTLVRDVFGIKPLYYSYIPGKALAYASEVPALLGMTPGAATLDWQTAFDYIQWGAYDHTERTFVSGLRQLMPGHYVTFHLTTGTLDLPQRYWWPDVATDESRSIDNAADEVRELFLESVRQNLRSDVPVGVALSGGIDSSAIVCAIRYLEPSYPLQTFSFVAPGFEQSEDAWIKLVVDHTRSDAHTVSSNGEELMRDLDSMILAQGEPFGSTSIYAQYRVFRLAHEHGIVVTLDGQGADEVFGGYSGYPAYRLQSLLEKGRLQAAVRFLNAWGKWPDRSIKQTLFDTGGLMIPRRAARLASRVLARRSPAFNYRALMDRSVDVQFPELTTESSRGNRLKSHLRSEMTSRGLPALLRHGDRNSMNFSVESRVPFLDRKLVEYTLGLPESFLVGPDGASKAILRRAMRGLVPDAILDRRDKVGFVTPERAWLAEMDAAESGLVKKETPSIGFLRNDVSGHAAVDTMSATDLGFGPRERWRLLNLRRWVDLLGVDGS